MKMVFSIILGLMVLVYALYQVFQQQYIQSIIFVLTAIWICWLLSGGFVDRLLSSTNKLFFFIILCLSIYNVFYESPAVSEEKYNKNLNFFNQSLGNMKCHDYLKSDSSKKRFYELKNKMRNKCALQNNKNAQDFIKDLYKAQKLEPLSSVIDHAYNEFLITEDLTCEDIAVELNRLCPGAIDL